MSRQPSLLHHCAHIFLRRIRCFHGRCQSPYQHENDGEHSVFILLECLSTYLLQIDTANSSDGKQYVLITPQNMQSIHLGNTVRVHRMSDPERGQGVLAYGQTVA